MDGVENLTVVTNGTISEDGFQSGEIPIWLECKSCGNMIRKVPADEERERYYCDQCVKDGKNYVSMRCLRHRKRFNVPKWWTEISQCLCPICFDKLSEEERGNYVLKGEDSPGTRREDPSRPTILPSKGKDEYSNQVKKNKELSQVSPEEKKGNDCLPNNETTESPTDSTDSVNETTVKKKVRKPRERKTKLFSKVSDNPHFAALLPRYSIKCQRCGQESPCHHSWFSTSTVLCPECYGKMSETAIRKFHVEHMGSTPKMKKPLGDMGSRFPDVKCCKSKVAQDTTWTKDSLSVNSGGCWSNDRVRSVSKKELLAAVAEGRVSKVRAKIELRRRQNREYYDMLPNEVGVRPIY